MRDAFVLLLQLTKCGVSPSSVLYSTVATLGQFIKGRAKLNPFLLWDLQRRNGSSGGTCYFFAYAGSSRICFLRNEGADLYSLINNA